MDLHARIAALESELASLKAVVAETFPVAQATSAPAQFTAIEANRVTALPSGRRQFFRTAAVAGVGVVAGSVAFAGQAAATDGQQLLLGGAGDTQNRATSPTRIQYDGAALLDRNVFTVTEGTPTTEGVVTSGQPSALAGYAFSDVKQGVYGFTNNSDGYGVVGINGNAGGGSGVWGKSVAGVAARMDAGKSHLLLTPTAAAGPTAVAHERGELLVDSNADLWFCVIGGTPGIWRKVSGPSTAGAITLLAAPTRVYDSRSDVAGKIAAGTDRVVSLNTAGGKTVVPVGATGALINITITDTVGSGFLAVYSAAVPAWPGTSNINWFGAGQNLANLTVSAVDATAKIKIYAGANVTEVIVDVLGYMQ